MIVLKKNYFKLNDEILAKNCELRSKIKIADELAQSAENYGNAVTMGSKEDIINAGLKLREAIDSYKKAKEE